MQTNLRIHLGEPYGSVQYAERIPYNFALEQGFLDGLEVCE